MPSHRNEDSLDNADYITRSIVSSERFARALTCRISSSLATTDALCSPNLFAVTAHSHNKPTTASSLDFVNYTNKNEGRFPVPRKLGICSRVAQKRCAAPASPSCLFLRCNQISCGTMNPRDRPLFCRSSACQALPTTLIRGL